MKKTILLAHLLLVALGIGRQNPETWFFENRDAILNEVFGNGPPPADNPSTIKWTALLRATSTSVEDSIGVRIRRHQNEITEIHGRWIPGLLFQRVLDVREQTGSLSIRDLSEGLGNAFVPIVAGECQGLLSAAIDSLVETALPAVPNQDLILDGMEYELWITTAFGGQLYRRGTGTGWSANPMIDTSFVGRAEAVRRVAISCLRAQRDAQTNP